MRLIQEKGNVNLSSSVLRWEDITPSDRPQFVLTEVQYDANRNPTLVRLPEAVNGRQPANQVLKLHDERDLLYREVRAPGDPAQSTSQRDYDGNGNLRRVQQGLESEPRLTTYAYDGYDRRASATDPMGNVTTYHYDANGNTVEERQDGELVDLAGGANNVRLLEKRDTYDAMDRRVRTDTAHFDLSTQAPIGDGWSTVQTFYSDNSQVIRVVDDNGHAVLTTYDTANRRRSVTDPKGNTTTQAYDANGNVLMATAVEKSDLGSPDQMFVTRHVYDNLDRPVATSDNVSNTNRATFDSRNNKTLLLDARGNATRSTFDGLNRQLLTSQAMTVSGEGGPAVNYINTEQTWDDDSRLTSQSDNSGNATRYAYDPLNRRIITQMADGTLEQVGAGAVWLLSAPEPDLVGFVNGYDVHGNPLKTIDPNGTVVSNAWDRLNRLVSRTVAPGAGVAGAPLGTTWESFLYDGLSRVVRAQDDDSLVVKAHDSLGNLLREEQSLSGSPAQIVTSTFDGEANKLSLTYPGGRVVTTTYDALDRPQQIADAGGVIATYSFIGPSRVERRDLGNGTRTVYRYDGIVPNPPGDYGVRKTVGITHSQVASGQIVDDRTFTWDRERNKTQRRDVRTGGPQLTHDYRYDSADRLVQSTRTPLGGVPTTTEYQLDGVGNRTVVVGGPNPGNYSQNPALPEPGDRQVNQYSYTPMDRRS